MKKLTDIFSDYRQQKKAIPAFNIDTFEIYQAVEIAVRQTNLPCLVQLSPGEDEFIEAERLFVLVKKAQIDGLPIYLNMDHGHDPARLKRLIQLGFDMVHYDGSKGDLTTNQMVSKDLVEFAHYHHTLVEVEFDQIKPTGEVDNNLTDPVAAENFVGLSNADLLAVSIGNQHGSDPSVPENLNFELLSQISQRIPYTKLTLHGGSGIDPTQIQSAIKQGIVKININTDLRQAFKKSLSQSLSQNPTEKIYELFDPAISTLVTLIKDKLSIFSAI